MTRIRIVGGGIAGLALAASLDPERFDVTLVEQRAELPDIRTILAMWPDAVDALERIGVADALRSLSPSIDRFPLRSGAGRTWAELPTPVASARRPRRPARGPRRGHPGIRRSRPERVDRDVEAPGELVVGADGVHSVVRRRAGAIERMPSSRRSWRCAACFPSSRPPRPRGSTGAGDGSTGWDRTARARTGTPRSLRSRPAARRRHGGPRGSRHGIRDLAPASPRARRRRPRDDARPAHLDRRRASAVRARRRARRRRRARNDPEPRCAAACEALIDAVALGACLVGCRRRRVRRVEAASPFAAPDEASARSCGSRSPIGPVRARGLLALAAASPPLHGGGAPPAVPPGHRRTQNGRPKAAVPWIEVSLSSRAIARMRRISR